MKLKVAWSWGPLELLPRLVLYPFTGLVHFKNCQKFINYISHAYIFINICKKSQKKDRCKQSKGVNIKRTSPLISYTTYTHTIVHRLLPFK